MSTAKRTARWLKGALAHSLSLQSSRLELLRCLKGFEDITFIRLYGNIGDELIYAGTRQLLSGRPYRELAWQNIEGNLDGVGGQLGLLAGSGGWCGPFQAVPAVLPQLEARFHHMIVLPSTFDVTIPSVRETLQSTGALVFARDPESYRQIRHLCRSSLAHDCAFFFDFSPYRRVGSGHLNAYRTDQESARSALPPDNDDISLSRATLDEWLWTIARYRAIYTDRAHVTIAGAMLGKEIVYTPTTYHKVPSIAQWALRHYPVTISPELEKPPRYYP